MIEVYGPSGPQLIVGGPFAPRLHPPHPFSARDARPMQITESPQKSGRFDTSRSPVAFFNPKICPKFLFLKI